MVQYILPKYLSLHLSQLMVYSLQLLHVFYSLPISLTLFFRLPPPSQKSGTQQAAPIQPGDGDDVLIVTSC